MTKQEWKDRYIAQMVKRGIDEEVAHATFEAGDDPVHGHDYANEFPEDMADTELSYWND